MLSVSGYVSFVLSTIYIHLVLTQAHYRHKDIYQKAKRYRHVAECDTQSCG